MSRELQIDRAVYLVDDETRTYRYLKRNPHWQELEPAVNDANKREIDGYTRLFQDGRKETFGFREKGGATER